MDSKKILSEIYRYKQLMNISEEKPNIGYIRQPDGISCGPTCIKMVGDFIQGDVGEISDICKKCGTDNLTGTPPERMIKGLDSLKIDYVIHSDEKEPIESLKNVIDRGHVALLRTLTRGMPHWIVLVDYVGDMFKINDPWLGQIEYDEEELRSICEPRNYYYFEIITGMKKTPSGVVNIRKLTNADIREIFENLEKIYHKTGWSKEDIWDTISNAGVSNESFVAEVDGKLAGFYFIGQNQIPGNIEEFSYLKKMKGVEGIALGVLPEYKNMGIGKKLIDYSRNNLNADYIWGYQLKSLKNIDDWLKRRDIYYEDSDMYITFEVLKK